mgnify:CR=1
FRAEIDRFPFLAGVLVFEFLFLCDSDSNPRKSVKVIIKRYLIELILSCSH